jgi:hypothetical protein
VVIDLGNRRSSYIRQNIFEDKYIVIGSTPAAKKGRIFVRVKLLTKLANYVPGIYPGVPFICKVPDVSTITDLLMHLRVPEREVSMVFVNGLHRSGEYQIKNDDIVSVFPLI